MTDYLADTGTAWGPNRPYQDGHTLCMANCLLAVDLCLPDSRASVSTVSSVSRWEKPISNSSFVIFYSTADFWLTLQGCDNETTHVPWQTVKLDNMRTPAAEETRANSSSFKNHGQTDKGQSPVGASGMYVRVLWHFLLHEGAPTRFEGLERTEVRLGFRFDDESQTKGPEKWLH